MILAEDDYGHSDCFCKNQAPPSSKEHQVTQCGRHDKITECSLSVKGLLEEEGGVLPAPRGTEHSPAELHKTQSGTFSRG